MLDDLGSSVYISQPTLLQGERPAVRHGRIDHKKGRKPKQSLIQKSIVRKRKLPREDKLSLNGKKFTFKEVLMEK